MPPRPVGRRPQPLELSSGPWRGMRDAASVTAHDPAFLLYAGNMYRAPGPAGSQYTSRPGLTALGDDPLGTVVQAVTTWRTSAGTVIRCAVVDGEIQTFDPSTATWTVVVTAANMATASVTLSTSALVDVLPFAGKLMLHDGVNDLVTWDGTSGAGGIDQIANVGPFTGPMRVYYAKLFARKGNTLVWSEENDPTLGYDVAPYNNAWDNPGGYASPMTGLGATNEALYVLRDGVSIAITGAVNADFQTAGTRANLSESVGTLSARAVLEIPQGVLVLDRDARAWLLRVGLEQPVPLWRDCLEQVRLFARTLAGACLAAFDPASQTIAVGIPELGVASVTRWIIFAADDLQCVGVWRTPMAATSVGPWIDSDGATRWAVGASDGGVYLLGSPTIGPWDDTVLATPDPIAVAVPHEITTCALGTDLDDEMTLSKVELGLGQEDATSVSLSYETPRGASSPLLVDTAAIAGGLVWDVDDWDEANWAGVTRDRTARAFLAGRGRWVRISARHDTPGESFGALAVRVLASRVPGNPKSP